MKITNNYNLPQSVYGVLSDTYSPKPDKIWITHLINAPLQRQLMLKHWNELEEDASDRLWSLLGKMGHRVFEPDVYSKIKSIVNSSLELTEIGEKVLSIFNGLSEHVWAEKHLEHVIDGITLSGRLDRYDTTTGTLEDFKFTSVYSFLLGDKPEWEAQLNVYAWLVTKHIQKENLPDICQPKQLYIEAILRDWMKSKTVDWDYPKTSFMRFSIPNWGFEKQEKYIKERIRLHLAPATECTPEEKWTRKSVWKLKKEGRKTSVKNEDSEEHIKFYAAEKGLLTEGKLKTGYSIEEHKGSNVKCESYCVCRKVCPYV